MRSKFKLAGSVLRAARCATVRSGCRQVRNPDSVGEFARAPFPRLRLLRRLDLLVVVLAVACSAGAQTNPTPCPGASGGTATQTGPGGTFCCTGTCCTQVAQTGTSQGVGLPGSTTTTPTTTLGATNFGSNFVNGSTAPNYEVQFPNFQVGATGAGDWNVRYGAIYYSINSGTTENMQTWATTCNYAPGGCSSVTPNGLSFCPVDLVVAGQYPNARYFSIANYDDHFTTAQHIADVAIDPLLTGTLRRVS